MLEYGGVQITWLGHDGFKLKQEQVVYLDPYQLKAAHEPADVVCVTHEHFDHFSLDDLKKVVAPATTLVTIAACAAEAKGLRLKEIRVVKPGDRVRVGAVAIEAVAAYNLDKFRSPGNPFHPQRDGKVGYVVTLGTTRIYHAGDTDQIPEMERAKDVDVALLPVSGTYVMTAAEAAHACDAIRPKLAIPMHYGAIVGDEGDAEAFRKGAACRVEILPVEG
jgi:L-ascorbate metabolism protein UlaG (beta-lactamase superfamily)